MVFCFYFPGYKSCYRLSKKSKKQNKYPKFEIFGFYQLIQKQLLLLRFQIQRGQKTND